MAQSWAIQFYNSKQWKELRQVLLLQRGPICERCHKNFMFDTSKLIAHHKQELTPGNITNPLIALNSDNIELVCWECHNKEHQRFGKGGHEVYLIYGAPCSGKSTLVNQMAHRGDLIVNMDRLYQAVSGCVLYDKPDNIKKNVLQVRDTLIEQIKTRYGQWNNAFIEGGYPIKAIREGLAQRVKAELIFCEIDIDRCLINAEGRGLMAKEWKGYIKRWFDMYQP